MTPDKPNGAEADGLTTRILLAQTFEQWVAWAADEFVAAAAEAVRRTGSFHVVLPGGSTPRSVLERISLEYASGPWFGRVGGPAVCDPVGASEITSVRPASPHGSVGGGQDDSSRDPVLSLEELWRATWVYFGDERGVGPDHADSNYRMVRSAWLDRMPLAPDHVHRIPGELPLEEAATTYNEIVAARLGQGLEHGLWGHGLKTVHVDRKRGLGFDLVVLGLGTDGHTASLIPGGQLDFVAEPWVGVGPAPQSPAQARRVTLTAPALRRTDRCVFWVQGAAKAEVVLAAVTGQGPRTIVPEVTPIAGEVTWILDAGAASRLTPIRTRIR